MLSRVADTGHGNKRNVYGRHILLGGQGAMLALVVRQKQIPISLPRSFKSFEARREHLQRVEGLSFETNGARQGQNLVLTVLFVPSPLDRGMVRV